VQLLKQKDQVAQVENEKNKIERTVASLNDQNKVVQEKIEQMNKEVLKLNSQLTTAQEENKKLNEQLKSNDNKNNDSKTYLFVLFKWSTEKHDLDLTVRDPKGNNFSFKRKTASGSSGLFALDSRSGPGAEIWQSSNPTPGQYTVTLKMYNNYGNSVPAKISGSILSNKTSLPITEKELPSKSGSEYKISFNIDDKGVVSLL
jgi:TolA-binding protein